MIPVRCPADGDSVCKIFAVHNMWLQQEQSGDRSLCACAYQPFRCICVKLMKWVGCPQNIMHAKECVCVCVQALALMCVCGRGIKKGLLSVCILLVHVCVHACVCVQQKFMSGRAFCGLGQWSITLWWWWDEMTTALSVPLASAW